MNSLTEELEPKMQARTSAAIHKFKGVFWLGGMVLQRRERSSPCLSPRNAENRITKTRTFSRILPVFEEEYVDP
jgi:hypothetical protein